MKRAPPPPRGTLAFAVGFIAAALSSMLTVVLGVVVSAEGLVLPAKGQALPRRAFWAIALSLTAVAASCILADLPRPSVILVAQLRRGHGLKGYMLFIIRSRSYRLIIKELRLCIRLTGSM